MIKVLMIGPGRDVKGGISTVINNYYACGLDRDVELRFLPTMEDGSKVKKLAVALNAMVRFGALVKQCDIVHVHMAAQASFDRKALFVERAYKAGKKIIIHQHSADFDKYFFEQSDETKRKRIKKVFGLADKVIVLSEEWADFFGKNVCDEGKMEIVYNGVLIPDEEAKDYGNANVLMLGRLGKRKGTYDLLEAIPEVLKKQPDACFYLGGDGEVEACRKIAAEKGILSHIKFMGWVRPEEKETYFKQCGVYVLPSYNEGMPMSLLEAMSYGLAAVSTTVGGIPQVIEQRENGILYTPGDIGQLVKSLSFLLTHEEERKRMGERASRTIREKFSCQKSLSSIEAIYQKVLGSGR